MRVLLGDGDKLPELYAAPDQPWLRVNMVATVDGAATGEDGTSRSINTGADKVVFDLLREQADALVVGAGTVVTPAQVQQVKDAGAQFVVTPGSPPRLLDAALASGLPLLAGAGTLTEMLTLAEAGLEVMKFFPAEASGGRPYLSAVSGPCPQLRFCPTGGITPETAAAWLALPNVGCVGGSWLTPKDAVAQEDWARIEALAAEAAALRLA